MANPLRVLIVEDSEDDALLLIEQLKHGGYEPNFARVDTPDGLSAALMRQSWDIVICDYNMPHLTGLEALKIVQDKKIDPPFIVVSGSIGEDVAVSAMRAGAHDYIMKGQTARLIPAIQRELKEAGVRRHRKLAEERIRYLAFNDSLTDLANRASLLERVQHTAMRQEAQPFAILVLGLHHFREINDTLGYENGDLLLKQTAARLRKLLRPADVAARLSGDEFGLMLAAADRTYAAQVANQVLEAFEAPFKVAQLPLTIGANIGIALFPEHGAEAQRLLQRADTAMSWARRSGEASAFYSSHYDPYSPERLTLIGRLRQAINGSHLALVFQTKLNLITGRAVGVEALTRWPTFQPTTTPFEIIQLAEKAGLINRLTLQVLEAAMKQSQVWREMGWNLPIAVNLSAKNLLDSKLIDKFKALMADLPLSPEALDLEITETAIMDDPVQAKNTLKMLRDMGMRIYIDDFGTGYSSLGYLKQLPIDAIKIDKSFVIDMTKNRDSATIVRSIIDLAHNLGLKVVAEGVENKAIWDALTALGCDEAQGYYIQHPVPAVDFKNFAPNEPWPLALEGLISPTDKIPGHRQA